MAIDDVDVTGSDAWWLRRLSRQMHQRPKKPNSKVCDDKRYEYTRNEWVDMLWARFTGNAPLSHLAEKYAETTREFLRLTKTNFAALVVEALQDRVQFVGAAGVQGQQTVEDELVRRFLSDNGAFMNDALAYTFATGTGVVMVSPPVEGSDLATATAEDPRQLAWSCDPIREDRIRVALKLYRDEEQERDVAHLFIAGDGRGPDRIRVAFREGAATWTGLRFDARSWSWDEAASGAMPVQGLGVPIVPIVNRLGMGEFEPHIDLLDRITNDIADRLWAAKYQIFIQRGIMSDSLADVDPKTGEDIDYDDIFRSDPAALWKLPLDAKIWESRQVSVQELLAPARDDIKELSAVTRTPLHMFSPDAMAGSAEGASLAREGLTFKAEDRCTRFTPAALRIARLGMAYSGQPSDAELRAQWAPVERYSLAQRAQAAAQAATSLPQRTIWTKVWQLSPEEVAQATRDQRAQALYDPLPAGGTPGASQAPGGATGAPGDTPPDQPPAAETP